MVRFPAAETAEKHEKILSEASRLFRERGIEGVSVADLMKAANLTHGSFYNHFDSKGDAVSACVTHVSTLALKQIERAPPTAAGKGVFASRYLSATARDNPGQACLMSSLGADLRLQPAARGAMTRYVQAFVGKLLSHFPWGKPAVARGDAIHMTAAMVGALVLARAVDDEKLSLEILKEVTRRL